MQQLYNTLSRTKENFQSNTKINLFVCGPTVYDYSHIGHARTYIFFDFFVKYLRAQGHSVYYLQNITDIDDKIIKRATEQEKNPIDLAKEFTKAYFDDMKSLSVDAVTKYASATEFIPEIIDQVNRLIEKGYAYKINNDGWYFDISKDEDYGKLSGRNAEQAEDAISRIDDAVGKRNKGDFCLWKFSKPDESPHLAERELIDNFSSHKTTPEVKSSSKDIVESVHIKEAQLSARCGDEPTWESSTLGAGRPGWHIEDTAITEKFFGPQYDIHGGGIDLKFPHHEAEIAQQESASGLKPFVKIWMHTGQLLVDGKKMSKSVGNFITVREFLEKNSSDVLRWIIFSHHYRAPLDYLGDATIKQAENDLRNIYEAMYDYSKQLYLSTHSRKPDQKESRDIQSKESPKQYEEKFLEAMNDDLNTPNAVAVIYETIKTPHLPIEDKINLLEKWDSLLHLGLHNAKYNPKNEEIIEEKIREYSELRVNKQFIQSDALRKNIEALGYSIRDTECGPSIVKRFF